MITLEEAKEQLLSQIELEATCRIHKFGSKAPEQLMEFHNRIAELPLSNPIFAWYRTNEDYVQIECIDDGVRIYREDDQDEEPEQFVGRISKTDVHDDLINQALDNKN